MHVFWQTGVIKKVTKEERAKFVINPEKNIRIQAERAASAAASHKKKEKEMSGDKKSLAARILEVLNEKKEIWSEELAAILQIDVEKTNSFYSTLSSMDLKKKQIHRKRVDGKLIIFLGPNPEPKEKNEALETPPQAVKEAGQQVSQEGAPQAQNIPEVIPAVRQVGAAPLIEEEEHKAIEEERERGETLQLPTGGGFPADLDLSESAPFRVALTSDSTVILFGLQDQPLELDKSKSAVLVNFIKGTGGPIWPLP